MLAGLYGTVLCEVLRERHHQRAPVVQYVDLLPLQMCIRDRLEAVRKWCGEETYRCFCEAVRNRTPYHSVQFDFRGYDGSLWVEPLSLIHIFLHTKGTYGHRQIESVPSSRTASIKALPWKSPWRVV